MTNRELKTAGKLLAPYCDRVDACGIDSGGWCITAHWLDGGQRIFYAFEDVRLWREAKSILQEDNRC